MRKWLGLGVLAAAVLGAIAYWQFNRPEIVVERKTTEEPVVQKSSGTSNDGDSEASEVIEPLIVDRGMSQEVMPPRFVSIDDGVSRVELTPGMKQPPRPDTDAPRMPYADEVTVVPVAQDSP
ncbi:MAG TPA: hypothetical protein VFE62_20355 [Gemmataceae bacterium]|nr:hypothetical protein [Gemmataceae bacterium]